MEREEEKLYIYSGILFHNQEFAREKEGTLTYDFSCPEFHQLKERYDLERVAGKGTDFQRARRLMHAFAPRLAHSSYYDNHIAQNALALLEYSLDKPDQGINCLNKSKILQEMCLALGIYARRVFLMPCSPYDMDNHVVTEIFDRKEKQWIMLDMTTDCWFVEENGKPLSLLQARDRLAQDRFVTAAAYGDKRSDLRRLREKNMELNAYYAKNLFWFEIDRENRFGRPDSWLTFAPRGFSISAVAAATWQFKLNHLPEAYETIRSQLEEQLEYAKTDPEREMTGIGAMTIPPVQ